MSKLKNTINSCYISLSSYLLCVSFFALLIFIMSGCKDSPATNNVEEDTKAKQTMQGVWIDDTDGDAVMYVKGDSIFYADSLSQPVTFKVVTDTLFLQSSRPSKYKILRLTDNLLKFLNSDGDEVKLIKSTNKSDLEVFDKSRKVTTVLNQGILIKRDTVLNCDNSRLHAYIQVNPTTYKVYKQVINEDGVAVDNAYYDNIVHVALFNGSKGLINKDFRKQDFEKYVPKDYISRSILSDIIVENVNSEGVTFVAILTTPDSYSSYNVAIFVSKDGNTRMSVK